MVDVDEETSDEEDANEENEGARVKKPIVSPVTIWIGVFPGSLSATIAVDPTTGDISRWANGPWRLATSHGYNT